MHHRPVSVIDVSLLGLLKPSASLHERSAAWRQAGSSVAHSDLRPMFRKHQSRTVLLLLLLLSPVSLSRNLVRLLIVALTRAVTRASYSGQIFGNGVAPLSFAAWSHSRTVARCSIVSIAIDALFCQASSKEGRSRSAGR